MWALTWGWVTGVWTYRGGVCLTVRTVLQDRGCFSGVSPLPGDAQAKAEQRDAGAECTPYRSAASQALPHPPSPTLPFQSQCPRCRAPSKQILGTLPAES